MPWDDVSWCLGRTTKYTQKDMSSCFKWWEMRALNSNSPFWEWRVLNDEDKLKFRLKQQLSLIVLSEKKLINFFIKKNKIK